MNVCTHWVGSDTKGHRCNSPIDAGHMYCPKHFEIEKRRVQKYLDKRAESDARAEAAWRARNVPRLPQMRVQLEQARAEYERRTASAVNDRAAVGGAMHSSIVRAQSRVLSDSNVSRVVELQRIIKRLEDEIARAEKPEVS